MIDISHKHRLDKHKLIAGIPVDLGSDDHFNFQYKVPIVGSSFTGKTCLIQRAIKHRFNNSYDLTFGADCFLYNAKISNNIISLQIWDTAGQEAFNSITKVFYKNAKAVIIVFDMTSKSSFESLETWIEEVRQNTEPKTLLFLVGNKIDLEDQIELQEEEVIDYAKKIGIDIFIKSSARTGENIQELFLGVCKSLFLEYAINEPQIQQKTKQRLKNIKDPQQKGYKCIC